MGAESWNISGRSYLFIMMMMMMMISVRMTLIYEGSDPSGRQALTYVCRGISGPKDAYLHAPGCFSS